MEISNAIPIQFWEVRPRAVASPVTLYILYLAPTVGSRNVPTTFNELNITPSIFGACFCQPMDWSDDVTIQFTDSPGQDYVLNLIRTDGSAFLFNYPFTEISSGVYQASFSLSSLTAVFAPSSWGEFQFSIGSPATLNTANILSPIASPEWANLVDGGVDWTFPGGGILRVALNAVTSPTSNRIRTPFSDTSFTKTHYVQIVGAAVKAANTRLDGYVEFKFYKNGAVVTELTKRSVLNFVKVDDVAGHTKINRCGIECNLLIPGHTATGTNYARSIDAVTIQVFLIPDVDSIATPDIQIDISAAVIELYDNDMEIYQKSDCHKITWDEWYTLHSRKAPQDSVRIDYSNYDDFNGIEYNENDSPAPEFSIRVPGTFYHDDFPKENEVIPLSDDTHIRVMSRMEKKKRLDIGFCPDWFHEKLGLILMHDNIHVGRHNFIDIPVLDDSGDNAGIDVVVKDSYDIEQGNKRYPLRRASILLTDKDYIKRNLL